MKKDLIFAPVLLAVGVLLFLLKVTGMTAHIAVSVVGILLLAVYTVLTRKTWKSPALEIAMRACYGIALITGVLVMKVFTVAAVAIAHKVFAAAFVVLLAVLLVTKLVQKKK